MTTFCFIVRPRSIRRLNFDLKFSAVQIYNTLEIINEHIINRLENILYVKNEGILEVYNPFDILLLFDTREFAAHWYRTGTPTFLVETLVRRGVSPLALEKMAGTDDLLSTFDVDDMATEALLFQTGYLTIRDHRRLGGRTVYRLGYPNQEVRQSLNDSLSCYLAGDSTRQMANSIRLYELLKANDFSGLKTLFQEVDPMSWPGLAVL